MKLTQIFQPKHAITQDIGKSMMTNPEEHIAIYLICHVISKREKKGDFSRFFTHDFRQIQKMTLSRPVFFEEQRALSYAKFVAQDKVVVKAYVPDSFITSHLGELSVSVDLLKMHYLHGCYQLKHQHFIYQTNPYFIDGIFSTRMALSPEE